MCRSHCSLSFASLLSLTAPPSSASLLGRRQINHVAQIPFTNSSSSSQVDCCQDRRRLQFFSAGQHYYYAQGMHKSGLIKRWFRHPTLFMQFHSQSNGARCANQIPLTEHSTTAEEKGSELIFLGTGTSEGIPRVSCLTDPIKKCPVCHEAVQPGNRNRRLNTSILIRYATTSGRINILIDAGKFFYHSALRWFPHFGLRYLDAVILTHSHADAIGGLDDLRDWTNNVQKSVPIYVAKRDLKVMEKTHYYLVDTSVVTPGAAVSTLVFNVMTEEPFHVNGLKVTPLPVWHGPGYRSLGFRFGNVCYISDVSDIPEETYNLLKDCELLIMDALRPDHSSTTHFGLPRALQEVRKIQPKQTLFTGMMHLMNHVKINEELARLQESEGLDVQLSYDGLCIPINL